jgi:hypothetical protein
MNLSRRRLWVLALVAALLSMTIAGQDVVAADLTGRWEGTWQSTLFTAGGTLTAFVDQLGSSVTGDLTVTDSACSSRATVTGTISDDTVVFVAVFSEVEQTNFSGTISTDGHTIEGTYDVISGPCVGDVGIWQVTKTVVPCDADRNGNVDFQDAVAVFRFLIQGIPLPGDGDCNDDGVVNFSDVIVIVRISHP